MHDRKADRLSGLIDRYPDIFLSEIRLSGDQAIVGRVGIGCGTEL
jgi:hypothetical protein